MPTKYKKFICPICGRHIHTELTPCKALLRQEYGGRLLEIYKCPCGTLIEVMNEWVHKPHLVEWEDTI